MACPWRKKESGKARSEPESLGSDPSDLDAAVEAGDHEAVRLLLHRGSAPLAFTARTFKPLYHNLWLRRHSDAVERLIHGDPLCCSFDSMAPLHRAAMRGDTRMISILLDHGADIQARTGFGMTALALAAWEGHDESVRLLLERKADPEVAEIYGRTPLALAVENGKAMAAVALIEAGAAVNVADQYATTPLHLAAQRGLTQLVSLLLSRGADPGRKDACGKLPRDRAPAFAFRLRRMLSYR